MNRDEVLLKAGDYINGQRAKDYGSAYDNFTRLADGWNLIVKEAFVTTGYITPQHVALVMEWGKTARLLNNTDHDDSWIDKCGYSALGAEFHEHEKKIKKAQEAFMGKRDEKAG